MQFPTTRNFLKNLQTDINKSHKHDRRPGQKHRAHTENGEHIHQRREQGEQKGIAHAKHRKAEKKHQKGDAKQDQIGAQIAPGEAPCHGTPARDRLLQSCGKTGDQPSRKAVAVHAKIEACDHRQR